MHFCGNFWHDVPMNLAAFVAGWFGFKHRAALVTWVRAKLRRVR